MAPGGGKRGRANGGGGASFPLTNADIEAARALKPLLEKDGFEFGKNLCSEMAKQWFRTRVGGGARSVYPLPGNAPQRRALATRLWNLFADRTRRGSKGDHLTAPEIRMLTKLLAGHGEPTGQPWAQWSNKHFHGRGDKFLEMEAERLKLSEGLRLPSRRCAYGMSIDGDRCSHTRRDLSSIAGLRFDTVPDDPSILSQMGIRASDYAKTLVCCNEHLENPRLPLSKQNMPLSRPTSSGRPRLTADRKEQLRQERLAEKELADEQRQRKRAKKNHQRALAEMKAARPGDLDGIAMALLEQIEQLTAQLQKTKQSAATTSVKTESQIKQLKQRVREFRPESLDDVDGDWIRCWTPFMNKATITAFFDVFVKPRVQYFESYKNYRKHKAEAVAPAAAAGSAFGGAFVQSDIRRP